MNSVLLSTSIRSLFLNGNLKLCDIQDLISGFDQEAAAVVMARLVSFKMETEVFFILHGFVNFKSQILEPKYVEYKSYLLCVANFPIEMVMILIFLPRYPLSHRKTQTRVKLLKPKLTC